MSFIRDRKGVSGLKTQRLKNTWAKILGTEIVCEECKSTCPRTGPSQQFCQPCSDRRAAERKLKWASANPSSSENSRRWAKNKRSRTAEVGALTSEGNRASIEDVFSDESGMAWVRRLSVPFCYSMSKNHMSRLSGTGHIYLRSESRSTRRSLADAVSLALSGVNVVQGKVWIDLIVHKPNHRGDAVNVLDLVIDGIKDALPVDDRWYCLRGLDWRIVKDSPFLLIGIGQEVTVDHRACSYCGRILPFEAFSANKGNADGIARGCKECVGAGKRKR